MGERIELTWCLMILNALSHDVRWKYVCPSNYRTMLLYPTCVWPSNIRCVFPSNIRHSAACVCPWTEHSFTFRPRVSVRRTFDNHYLTACLLRVCLSNIRFVEEWLYDTTTYGPRPDPAAGLRTLTIQLLDKTKSYNKYATYAMAYGNDSMIASSQAIVP